MSIREHRRGIEASPFTSTLPSTAPAALLPLFHPAEIERIVATCAGSTTHRSTEAADVLRDALTATLHRTAHIAAVNTARRIAEQAERDALDAAVDQVFGALVHTDYRGAPRTAGIRIQAAVRRGHLSSTLGSSDEFEGGREPTPRMLREACARHHQKYLASSVLSRHHALVETSHDAASTSTDETT